jgi:gamma-glutamyltranspeptidase/glutathione hydrolase
LEALADAAPLGATFDEQLEEAGKRFYLGDIAQNIVNYLQANGGIITMADMAKYYGSGLDDMSEDQGLRLRTPVIGSYRGYSIVAMAPTSSGGTGIVQQLNVLEGYNLPALGFGNPKTAHLMAEAMKIYWADRDRYMGDPDYANNPLDPCGYDPPPVEQMISKDYADERRSEIHPRKAGTYEPGEFNYESENTTHATAIDIEGNIISMTQTQNSSYGPCIALPGLVPGSGMMLNNTMRLFDPDPRCGYERANGIAPNKRMLSSMSPTIVLKDDKPFMAIGTPGGTRIFSTVMQGIINVIDHGMNIQQAVEAPRIWTMMYGDLNVEYGYPDEVVAELESMGHSIRKVKFVAGCMNGVLVDANKLIHGGACWRRDGTVGGWSGGDALSSDFDYPPSWDIP